MLAVASVAACNQADDRPAQWAYISPAIMQPNCASASCHSPAAAASGLDFSTPENGYASLTRLWVWVVYPGGDGGAAIPPGTPCAVQNGTEVCEEKVRPLVTPYDPDQSRLVNVLLARDAPRMPPDRPLTQPDIALIERWILNGAFEYANGTNGNADVGVGAGGPDGSPTDATFDRGSPSDGPRDGSND